MNTKVISAFPACGKSYAYENYQKCFNGILDSDSSEFSWIKDEDGNNRKERNLDFPIKENIGESRNYICKLSVDYKEELWSNIK